MACLAILLGCAATPPARAPGGHVLQEMTVEAVLMRHTAALMSLPGVVGTAQGRCGDRDCIKVFVRRRTHELEQRIPASLEGYPVEIEVTGDLRALPE
jgi:hypothetical protein